MKKNVGANVALVAVFAALITAFATMPPLFVVGAVPFAIQLIPILLAPLVLGPWQGTLANALYVVAGAAGLPVFAGGKSGVAVLVGPTGGYVVGYIVSAVAAGLVASLVLKHRVRGGVAIAGLTGAALVGVLAIHVCGVIGLMALAKLGFGKAVVLTVGFLPLDIVKAGVAALVALALVKAFPRLLGMRV